MNDIDVTPAGVSHQDAYNAAIAAGCKPVWYDGILGPAWHCDCDEDGPTHYIDQQCSVVRFYRE